MSIIYMAIGFLIALFLPNAVDDVAKRIVIAAAKRLWDWIKGLYEMYKFKKSE